MKYIKPIIYSGIVVSALTGAYFMASQSAKGDLDLPGINQQLDHQQEQLNNHEARITNNESNIKSVQDKTNTSPAPNPVAVPKVVTPTAPQATPTPQPAPPPTKTVTTNHFWQEKRTDVPYGYNQYCDYTYDDGSKATTTVGKTQEYNDSTPVSTPSCQSIGSVVPK